MTEARKELREEVAIALSMVDPDSRGIPDGVTMAEFYRSLADAAIAVALERAAKVADAYAVAALKCDYCGDIRHTYAPGGCAGETKWKATEGYRTMVTLDGTYEATRYFEKRLCDPKEMDQKEAFEAFAAAIRALIPRD